MILIGVTTPILALNEPANVTSSYEVLEPETWAGKRLPIMEHIDIGEQLEKGRWIIFLYRHNCPVCLAIYGKFEQMAHNLANRGDCQKKVALVEVPPYGLIAGNTERSFISGKLSNDRKWFVDSCLILLSDGIIQGAWSNASADLNAMLECFINIP